MDNLTKFISYLHIFLGGLSAEQLYVVGSVLGASGLLVGSVAWSKRHHLKESADKLEDWIITLLIWFYSFVLSIGSFVVAVAAFGLDPHMFLHYFGSTWPYIVAFGPGLYTFSKAAKKKLAERKAKKIHLTDELIDGFVDVPKPPEKAPIPAVTPDIWSKP